MGVGGDASIVGGVPAQPLDSMTVADLAHRVRRAVMLSMQFTSMEPIIFDHTSGTTSRYTHDDYDDAHDALNELVRRAS